MLNKLAKPVKFVWKMLSCVKNTIKVRILFIYLFIIYSFLPFFLPFSFLFFFMRSGRKEGNVLFNDTLNTFYLWLYGIGHMVKNHSDSERGNPLPPHRLLFPISS